MLSSLLLFVVRPPTLVMQGAAALRCTSAGTQLRAKTIAYFDRSRQVYHKHELSPLPFQPPAFHAYAISMLSGTFKVGTCTHGARLITSIW